VLSVRSASKRYGIIEALSDVSLDVSGGEVVAVLGENGAGKSTLVRCIARSVPLDSGEIFLNGESMGRRM